MKIFCSLLVLTILTPLFAFETDPNNMKLLQCMALYDFDFVADELGFKIDLVDHNGKTIAPPSDEERAKIRSAQADKFLATGKLTARAPVPARGKQSKSDREMARRCQIIADAVMEAAYLRGQLEPDDSDKSRPRLLEQPL